MATTTPTPGGENTKIMNAPTTSEAFTATEVT